MWRRDLLPHLLDRPATAAELSRELSLSERDIEDMLEHLARSLRKSPDHELLVTPAGCRKCGFRFAPGRFSRPGKCPECRETWIQAPVFEVRARPA